MEGIFTEEKGKVGLYVSLPAFHVGILLGDGKIIHAFGKVRKDDIDASGIINRETGERTHSLKMVRTIFCP